MRRPVELSVLAITAGLGAAPAIAWAVGDQSESGAADNRAVQPLKIPTLTWWLLGIGSLIALGLAFLRVFSTVRSDSCSVVWLVALGAFATVGGGVGLGYRIATARVTGANIGYGIFMIFVGPMLLATLLFAIGALVRAWQLQRRPPF